MVWIILWKTTYKNELSELKISNQIIESWKYSPFENITVFEYKDSGVSLNNKFTSEWAKSDFNISGKIKNNILTEWNIKLLVETKDSTYDYKSYKRIYSWDFKKIVDSNINLKYKKIAGFTKMYKDNKEFLNITHIGKSEKDFFELNNKIIPWELLIWEYQKGFNWSLERARDSVRIIDLKALQASIEQVYQDTWEYPTKENFNESVSLYMNKIPKDPKWNIEINGCKFGYIYEVWDDINWIKNSSYKLSSCLEEKGSYRLIYDEGTDNNRIEFWAFNKNTTFNSKMYINNYKTWNKIKKEESKKDISAEINLNLNFDTRWNKNNWNIYIDAKLDDKKVLEFELDNKSIKTYKKINIEKPAEKDTISIEEAIWNPRLY